MTPQARPCPMCGEGLDTSMQIDVCRTCYQELRSSGEIALHSTSEFAPITRGDKSLRPRPGQARARTGEIEGDVVCTWCGKSRKTVKKILASGNVRICNECVALCAEVLEAELGTDWR